MVVIGHQSSKSTFGSNNGHLDGIFYEDFDDDSVDEDFDHVDYNEDVAIRKHITFICKNRQFEIISSRV